MKRILILLVLFALGCMGKTYSQIFPGQGSVDSRFEKRAIMEKTIDVTETLLRDTTFSSLTLYLHDVSDEQWRRIKDNLNLVYRVDAEDSVFAQKVFNWCLIEKYFLVNYRRYERKMSAFSKSVGYGMNAYSYDDKRTLDGGETERNLMNCTWKQVWDVLSENDLVIEFTNIDGNEMAVLMDKKHRNPVLIRLEITEEDKVELLNEELLDDELLDDGLTIGFWGNCLNFMEGKNRIFFSPSISLSNVALEYLPINGKTMFETYPLYRVSSSREICKKRQNKETKSIFVFGDIRYDAGVDVIRGDNLGQLPFTKNEVEGILTVFDGKKAIVHPYMGLTATERNFRSLSNREVTMLHIASHGQYKAPRGASEEDAMRGSILAFCGYNIYGADVLDDGKVTAEDIALMNLNGCELVVLSACKTGLGEVGLDGVYGLQRGFKSAGVDAILMSTRNVHDEATAKLMIAFYRELASGSTKRAALKAAMAEIRGIDKYKKAEYWASFILLDGLDEQ